MILLSYLLVLPFQQQLYRHIKRMNSTLSGVCHIVITPVSNKYIYCCYIDNIISDNYL